MWPKITFLPGSNTKSSNIFNIKNISLTSLLEISKPTVLFYTLTLNNSFPSEKIPVSKLAPFELYGEYIIETFVEIFLLALLSVINTNSGHLIIILLKSGGKSFTVTQEYLTILELAWSPHTSKKNHNPNQP